MPKGEDTRISNGLQKLMILVLSRKESFNDLMPVIVSYLSRKSLEFFFLTVDLLKREFYNFFLISKFRSRYLPYQEKKIIFLHENIFVKSYPLPFWKKSEKPIEKWNYLEKQFGRGGGLLTGLVPKKIE